MHNILIGQKWCCFLLLLEFYASFFIFFFIRFCLVESFTFAVLIWFLGCFQVAKSPQEPNILSLLNDNVAIWEGIFDLRSSLYLMFVYHGCCFFVFDFFAAVSCSRSCLVQTKTFLCMKFHLWYCSLSETESENKFNMSTCRGIHMINWIVNYIVHGLNP